MQRRKVDALALWPRFHKIVFTHQYGIARAKPSVYCFEKIRSWMKCDFRDMVYIGDDPTKDFVNTKSLGIHTIRVLTGRFRNVKVSNRLDADKTISCVSEFRIEGI